MTRQHPREPAFPLEVRYLLGALEPLGQDLYCYPALELELQRLVHAAKATPADLAQGAITFDRRHILLGLPATDGFEYLILDVACGLVGAFGARVNAPGHLIVAKAGSPAGCIGTDPGEQRLVDIDRHIVIEFSARHSAPALLPRVYELSVPAAPRRRREASRVP